MIGMGGSDKLHPSGPDRYHYAEQRGCLFALWEALDLGDNVTLVLHDWGSVLGFDWANQHRDRIQGIAFMEASVTPISWSEFPPDLRGVFEGFRSPQGETMVLEQNMFIEQVLPAGMQRTLSNEEMDHYRQPFVEPGESRRPTLSWPRNIPIDGEPAYVTSVVNDYGRWLAESDVPKLFINAEPGAIVHGASATSSARGRTSPRPPSAECTSSRRTAPTKSAPPSRNSCASCVRPSSTSSAVPDGSHVLRSASTGRTRTNLPVAHRRHR